MTSETIRKWVSRGRLPVTARIGGVNHFAPVDLFSAAEATRTRARRPSAVELLDQQTYRRPKDAVEAERALARAIADCIRLEVPVEKAVAHHHAEITRSIRALEDDL